jgi:hypothetical protein
MAQFIREDVIIISIDESNFKSDSMPSKQWQFDNNSLDPKVPKNPSPFSKGLIANNVNLLFRTDEEISYASYLQ